MTFHAKDAQTGTATAFATQTDPDGSDNVERIMPVRAGDIASALTDDRKTVTTAGTAVAIHASLACRWVLVTALKTNTDVVAVGGSGVVAASGSIKGQPLSPGESVSLPVDNASKVFVDARVNGEGVSFTVGS